ncbi:hypothetical protein N1851_033766 [Merluccius polli]|uniref:Secreted protein n=1 Tax=Merluccius polli TaxID=89951 RepID=A0AA47NP71_MERPO|nr:hypothetical protein N1851_033766 [Merluccius polli]
MERMRRWSVQHSSALIIALVLSTSRRSWERTMTKLDYCNALLSGIPNKSIQKLQHIQNSAARILLRVRKYEHITPILHSLHWLPISARINYKVSLLTFQCIHGNAPQYLKELLTPQTSARSLRSTNSHRLLPPRTKSRTLGDRAFCSSAPRLWNTLPEHLRLRLYQLRLVSSELPSCLVVFRHRVENGVLHKDTHSSTYEGQEEHLTDNHYARVAGGAVCHGRSFKKEEAHGCGFH